MKYLILLAALCFPMVAHAQPKQVVSPCGSVTFSVGMGANGTVDTSGNTCVTSVPATAAVHGYGSLTTGASALINTMTVNAAGTALPTTLTYLITLNVGATDVAICAYGGTCTCPANAVATTNGETIKAGGASWTHYFSPGIASATPTIVACSGTPVVTFQW